MIPPELTELEAATRLAIAALVGLGVGLERQWSGHASGPHARFAGIRTFLLLGITGGIAGILIAKSFVVAGAAIIAAVTALSVSAYVLAVRRDPNDVDGTTEAAALVVIALACIAGVGMLALAAGAGSIVVLVLREKTRLHWFVRRVGEPELRAALQFAVLALVVLPLLPEGPYGGDLDLRPRSLWTVVLLFSGLDFLGFLARRAVGAERGYPIAGALGGAVSSTAVTFAYARQSRKELANSAALALGTVAACTVILPRVAIVSATLSPAVASALVPLLVAPFIVGAAISFFARGMKAHAGKAGAKEGGNPLRLGTAIKMAIAFQVGMLIVSYVTKSVGTSGLYATGALIGTTDMDVLTFTMSRDTSIAADLAARVIAVGIMSNTVVKLGMALGLGSPAYRLVAAPSLVAIGAAIGLGLWFL